MSTDKESSTAGTDNRPPMLVQSDYDSWKIRIHRYIRGKPLAMATTNIFKVNHEDAYDSDVDEGPNAAAAFMVNLSSTSGNNHHVNKVHPNAIQINDSVNYQLSDEMHHEEQSDSNVESELDDNTTPYHQLELERRANVVPIEVSTGSSTNISMVTILDEM
ncbi:hypothetical protein Tco_0662075 [Tanacetum coccineum]